MVFVARGEGAKKSQIYRIKAKTLAFSLKKEYSIINEVLL